MEDDAGGSSQDRYESDFINDDGREQIEINKARKLKQGHIDSSDEEEFMVDSSGKASLKKTKKPKEAKQTQSKSKTKPNKAPVVVSESEGEETEEEEDEEDPYNALTLAPGQDEGGFKYNAEEKEYILPDYFSLPEHIYERLFEHQKKGVIWLYNLYRDKKGGVLGDDMGLGKTVQVASLCKGLFENEIISKVLIVVPATMKMYWQGELTKWCPDVDNIMQFDDKKKVNRE